MKDRQNPIITGNTAGESDVLAVRLLDLHQGADYLSLSYWTLRTLINNGSLPAVRIGRRLLIDRHDLDRFIEAHKMQLDD